ncbi:hypothetical protein CRUP_010810 [Coryphaenoides rupestris]|nr:hypothetical protein CRUP_010810 [Coryphaenoides rupestris]
MGVPAYALTIAVSFVLSPFAGAETQGPLVNTRLGAVRGQYLVVKGQEAKVQAYLGIPFAQPPVGQLRLSPPLPAEPWETPRDATKQPRLCIQNRGFIDMLMEMMGIHTELPDLSEDCLYLNVYAPAKAAPGTNLPDVVVVVIQYRLGLLGFLSTGDDTIPGNLGLLDQVEALRWVQQNIGDFGGNPELVTICGESAGGISVSLLAISPLSTGLFHRAIAESGTAAMALLVTDQPDSTVQDQTLRYSVVVDGHFLTDKVNTIYQNKKFPKIPFMTGVNDDEGGWLLPTFFAPPNWTEGMDRDTSLAIMGMFYPEPKDKPVPDLLAEEYFGNTEDRNEIRRGFTDLLGDVMFTIPAIQTANAHRDAGAPVYLYQYRHAPQFLKERRSSFVGVDHGDEIFIVLGLCFTATDTQLSKENYLSAGMEQEVLQQLAKDRYTFITQTIPEKLAAAQKGKTEHSDL